MISIIIVDYNAKVGQDNTGYERVMGNYGSGTMNEDIFCGDNHLLIGGTLYPHKKYTS